MVLVSDIVTKRLITTGLELHEVRQVVGDYARLTYIHNPGAAFGLFPGSRIVLIFVSVAAVTVVLWAALRRSTPLHTALPLGLILGGALGNLIDRVRLGQVVDFIQVGIPPHYFPVFNVADSAVTVGVAWLALGLVLWGKPQETVPEPGTGGPPEDDFGAMAPSRDDG